MSKKQEYIDLISTLDNNRGEETGYSTVMEMIISLEQQIKDLKVRISVLEGV